MAQQRHSGTVRLDGLQREGRGVIAGGGGRGQCHSGTVGLDGLRRGEEGECHSGTVRLDGLRRVNKEVWSGREKCRVVSAQQQGKVQGP